MTTDQMVARQVLRAGTWEGAPTDQIVLDYEGRLLRRRRLTGVGGASFLLDLPEVTDLQPGDALELANGDRVVVVAADESLLRVAGANLARLAWHIGNRHTPCQIFPTHLLIRDDHVLKAMLEGLGAEVTPLSAPFTPEGGAYGHGRTFGHDHGHSHD